MSGLAQVIALVGEHLDFAGVAGSVDLKGPGADGEIAGPLNGGFQTLEEKAVERRFSVNSIS